MDLKKVNKREETPSDTLDREIREKFVSRGAASLTDTELLSIIIQEGRPGVSAYRLAQRVLESAGESLIRLAGTELRKLRSVEGVGIKRAAVIAAALELGNRLLTERSHEPSTITSNEDVSAMFSPLIAHLPYEEFWIIYLSSANTILDKSRVGSSGAAEVYVDPKLIVKRAVELLASSIIMVHNHPSGIARPSDDDKQLTDKIITAAALFEISVLDHLILTTSGSFSFRAEGLL